MGAGGALWGDFLPSCLTTSGVRWHDACGQLNKPRKNSGLLLKQTPFRATAYRMPLGGVSLAVSACLDLSHETVSPPVSRDSLIDPAC